jgi:RNA polymerase sigma factor (sigma-70 family)
MGRQPVPIPSSMSDESAPISDEAFCAAFELLATSGHSGGPLPDPVRAALEVVYRVAAPRLRLLLRARFKAASDLIADAISAVFARLVTRGVPPGTEPVRSPMAWLTAAAYNAAWDALRDAARRPSAEIPDVPAPPPAIETPSGLPPDVEECLGHLSDQEREVVTLRYAGFSGDEVAQVLRTTANAVYVAFNKAKARLRRCLGEGA